MPENGHLALALVRTPTASAPPPPPVHRPSPPKPGTTLRCIGDQEAILGQFIGASVDLAWRRNERLCPEAIRGALQVALRTWPLSSSTVPALRPEPA